MPECAQQCFVPGTRQRHVCWADEQGDVLVQHFEYPDETESSSDTSPLAMDVMVVLLTLTTVFSMSLGYFGHMLKAFFLLAVMIVGMAHSMLVASGVDLSGAFGLVDDEDEDEKEDDQVDADQVRSCTEAKDKQVEEGSGKRLHAHSETRLPAEDKAEGLLECAHTAGEQCEVLLKDLETSGEADSLLPGLAPAQDVVITVLTCIALVSSWLGCNSHMIAATSLVVVAMLMRTTQNLSTRQKSVEGEEDIDQASSACVSVTLDDVKCTIELAM